jgi:hypothetical protein
LGAAGLNSVGSRDLRNGVLAVPDRRFRLGAGVVRDVTSTIIAWIWNLI